MEIYSASGLLETKQETIHGTRNATVVRENVSSSTTTQSAQAGSWRNVKPAPVFSGGYSPGGYGHPGRD